MNTTSKNILITGGLGYIGSHIALKLIEENDKVVIIDNLSNTYDIIFNQINNKFKNIEYYNIDCNSYKKVEDIFKKYNFHSVVYLSDYKYIKESESNPEKYLNSVNNLSIISSLSNKYDVINFIYTSSTNIYGNRMKLPFTENSITRPNNNYGLMKVTNENFLKGKMNEYNMNTFILRYSDVIGSHPSCLIGELRKSKYKTITNNIIENTIGIESFFTIEGNDYFTADGTYKRDFIDVNDLSNAYYAIINNFNEQNNNYRVYNISGSYKMTILQLIRKYEEVNDIKLRFIFAAKNDKTLPHIDTEGTKFKTEMTWEPIINIEDSMRNTYNWSRELKKLNI